MRLRLELAGAIAARIGWLALAAVTLAGWLFLVFDRWLEPSANVRFAVEAALLAAGLGWLVVVAAPRLTRLIADRDILTLLHRQRPHEATLIATSLELRGQPGSNQALRDATIATADASARSLVDITLVRPPSSSAAPWFASFAAAAALLLALVRPDMATCFVQRVALSESPWPRRVSLVAEGFAWDQQAGEWTRVVARGEPTEFEIVAQVDGGDTPPDTLWARGGSRGMGPTLTTLTRVGTPVESDIVRQRYRRRIDRVDGDVPLTIRGGDGRLKVRLVAADRPKLTDLTVRCDPPAYLQSQPTTTGSTTLAPLPEGSTATITAGASKKLASIEASYRNAETPAPQALSTRVQNDGNLATIETPPLSDSLVVSIVATAADGLLSEPIELPLEVAKDTPPGVTLTLDGVGRAVTRDARLPVRVRLEDDHGVADVKLELRREDRTISLPLEAPLTLPKAVRGEADLLSLRSADVSQRLDLQPGDRVHLVATAADRYDLAERPRAASQSVEIEIVTPAELLARVSDAQRDLRATLEALRTDVERLEYEIDLERRRVADAEAPGDRSRWVAERLLDARKASDGVADAATRADGIRQQVVNNRLEQPDLVDRLQRRVVQPLRAIEERHLASVSAALRQSDGQFDAALAGVQTAKKELERVLSSLDTQQTYNEVVSMLRGLIREQQRVNEKTARQESDDVRSLFD